MPTRIFFANGETVTVSDEIGSVAEKLGSAGLARLDRPWGDSFIFVNGSSVNYIEAEEERAPDIEALEAAGQPHIPPPS
jgi:hypothetical protein